MEKVIAVGGTFDVLHKGHKEFLKTVFSKGDKIIVGLTSDTYVNHNKPGSHKSYEERKNNLTEFLEHERLMDRTILVPIDDFYGPLLNSNLSVMGIAVSSASVQNAILINEKRNSLGLPELTIYEIPLVYDKMGEIISATRIKKGEIDAQGKILHLPEKYREKLQEAWGEILKEVPEEISTQKVTVGDVTTKNFIENGITPKLSIIDKMVERSAVNFDLQFEETTQMFDIQNNPGTINDSTFVLLEDIFKSDKNACIRVQGEEDLLVLPVIIAAPNGTEIFYGQPHVGMVRLAVSDDLKNKAHELLSLFEQ